MKQEAKKDNQTNSHKKNWKFSIIIHKNIKLQFEREQLSRKDYQN